MLELFDARPDEQRGRWLRKEVNERFLRSFRYLLDKFAAAGLDIDSSLEKLDQFDPDEKLSGMMHVVNNRLIDAAKTKDLVTARQILASMRQIDPSDSELKTVGWYIDGYCEHLHELYFDACDAGFRSTYGVHFDGAMLTDTEFRNARSAASQALNRLQAIDEDGYAELKTLVSDIMLIQSPTMNAASSLSSLGIVRVSQLRPGQTWTRYLENFAHEAGHQYLNYLAIIDPVIVNESAGLFSSPLRKEQRPLSGIFHALFVLGRTMRMMRLLTSSSDFDPGSDRIETSYNNAGNDASFEEKFSDCWNILDQNAVFTELGKKLFHSSRRMAFS